MRHQCKGTGHNQRSDEFCNIHWQCIVAVANEVREHYVALFTLLLSTTTMLTNALSEEEAALKDLISKYETLEDKYKLLQLENEQYVQSVI